MPDELLDAVKAALAELQECNPEVLMQISLAEFNHRKSVRNSFEAKAEAWLRALVERVEK